MRSQSNKDYYKILQIDPSADPEIIAVAYKRLARKYHPDTNGSSDATLRMQEINAAYQVLRDPVKRAQYDRERSFHSSQSHTREEEARRKQEETEAALRRSKEAAEATQRRAEEERRKREAAEAAQRHTEEEQRKREAAEAVQRHAKAPQLWWGLPGWVFYLSLLGILVIFSWLSTQITQTQQVAPLVRDHGVSKLPILQDSPSEMSPSVSTISTSANQAPMPEPPSSTAIEVQQRVAQLRQRQAAQEQAEKPIESASQTPKPPPETAEYEQPRSSGMKYVAPDPSTERTRSAAQESEDVQFKPSVERTTPAKPTGITQTTPSKPSTILNNLSQRSEPGRSQSKDNVVSVPNFFTIGSTKDEVLAVQGTPDRLTNDAFHYGLSDVFFQNGRVVSWDNRRPTLKVSLEPARATIPSLFPAGSTKDKESATQGTPDKFKQDSLMSTYAMDQKAKDIERARFWKQHGYDFNPDNMTAYAMDQKVKDIERARFWKQHGYDFNPDNMTAYAMDQKVKDIERAQYWKASGLHFDPNDMTAYAMDQKVKDIERAQYWKASGLHFDPNDMTAYAMDQEAKRLLQHAKP